jgi:hypothetical protein
MYVRADWRLSCTITETQSVGKACEMRWKGNFNESGSQKSTGDFIARAERRRKFFSKCR